jgi:hypothetical protein
MMCEFKAEVLNKLAEYHKVKERGVRVSNQAATHDFLYSVNHMNTEVS